MDNWKYKEYNKSEIIGDLEIHRTARFILGERKYSIYRNDALNYDLVHDNSNVMMKLKKFKSLDNLFEWLKYIVLVDVGEIKI